MQSIITRPKWLDNTQGHSNILVRQTTKPCSNCFILLGIAKLPPLARIRATAFYFNSNARALLCLYDLCLAYVLHVQWIISPCSSLSRNDG